MSLILTSKTGVAPEIPNQNAVKTFLESEFLQRPDVQNTRIFVDALTDQSYTTAQFRKGIPRAAALFRSEYGVKKDDIVGIFGVNHIFTPIVHFASLSLGAIISPANIMYSAEELSHQLEMTHPVIIVVFDPAKPVVEEACKLSSCSARIVTFTELFPKLVALLSADTAPEVYPVDLNPKEQSAYLCFSSGTSGLPKAVDTTHYNIIGNVLQQVAAKIPLCNPGYPQSGLLPMSHIYGLNASVWLGAYCGKMTVVFPKFDLELLVTKAIQYKLGILLLVPPIILLLGKTDIIDRYPEFATTVKYIMSGAAPLSKDTIELVLKKAPQIFIAQGYGLTETTPVVSTGFHADLNTQEKYNRESIGWLLPGAEARLVNPDTKQDVNGIRQPGELWVRGPMVMRGYYKNPKANKEVFAEGGWFKTGDVAIIDELDQLHIVDRIKELIKSNGHQVAPAELESIFLKNDDVLDVAVIGVMNADKTSENPRAYLVLRPGADVVEVLKWFNGHVAKHKRLWGGAVVTDVIPKSASGKILRNDLRKRKDEDEDKVVGRELVSSAKL